MFLQGKFSEAELLYERSSNIQERMLMSEHPSAASSDNNRAALMIDQVGTVAMIVAGSLEVTYGIGDG